MIDTMNHFKHPDLDLYFSKNDPLDPRLGEVFRPNQTKNSDSVDLFLQGYPDDEGIQKNGGRLGAAEGPDQIRRWLFRMSPPFQKNKTFSGRDGGNLSDFKSLSLPERHEKAYETMSEALKKSKAISFGGGHDYGYADGKAFLKNFLSSSEKPLIINFDAHLDVRDLRFGITSGTPFFRLKTEFPEFEMIQVGIQNQCNSSAHLEWCAQNGIDVLFLHDFYGKTDSLKEFFERKWGHHLKFSRPAFLSVDIDAFSSAYAPGCSQSWPTGVEPKEFFEFFSWILEKLDVKLLSIYEVSPPLDVQSVTAKLAALIAYRFIEDICSKK